MMVVPQQASAVTELRIVSRWSLHRPASVDDGDHTECANLLVWKLVWTSALG